MAAVFAFLLLFAFPGVSRADYLDSLEYELKKSGQDTNRVFLLNELCWEYQSIDYEKAMIFGDQALDLAKKLDFRKGVSDAQMLIGMIYDDKGEYNAALQRYKLALIIRQDLENSTGIASAYNNIGTVYFKMGKFAIAVSNYSKAVDEWKKAGNKSGLASTYINMGLVYNDQANVEMSLEYYTKSLKVYEELGDKDGFANALIKIAGIYTDQGNYDEALDYCNQALVIYDEASNLKGRGSALNDIGVVYKNLGKFEVAIDYFTKALNIRTEIGDVSGISASMNNIGYAYFMLNDHNKALEYYMEALDNFRKIGYKQDITITLCNIGDIYMEKDNPSLALKYYSESLEISQEVGYKEKIRDNLGRIAEAYARMGNYVRAYELHKQYYQFNDSLYNAQRSKVMAEMQTIFDTERKEKKIEILKKDKEILVKDKKVNDLQLRQNRILMISILIGFLLLGSFSIMLFRANNQKKQVLELLRMHNSEIIQKNREIQAHRDEIAIKNRHITDSIKYAQRIQTAILPNREAVKYLIPDNFILYMPKDIVSGDFYWVEEKEGKIFFGAIDCTGHGVPGAFVSIVGYNLLNQALHEYNITKPSDILNYLSTGVFTNLRKTDDFTTVKVGMDVALCAFDRENMKLEFAGAFNPLYILRNGEIEVFKGDKYYIGELFTKEFHTYTNTVIDVQKGDVCYVFSDGFIDQLGGDSRKRYLSKKFRDKLIGMSHIPLADQREILEKEIFDWRGDVEQIDDVLVMGVRIT